LRIVPPGEADAAAVPMDEALTAAVARVSAQRPTVVLMVWEKPDGTLELVTLPKSLAVAKGLVLAAYAALFPEDGES
jgi:hypothetical protein